MQRKDQKKVKNPPLNLLKWVTYFPKKQISYIYISENTAQQLFEICENIQDITKILRTLSRKPDLLSKQTEFIRLFLENIGKFKSYLIKDVTLLPEVLQYLPKENQVELVKKIGSKELINSAIQNENLFFLCELRKLIANFRQKDAIKFKSLLNSDNIFKLVKNADDVFAGFMLLIDNPIQLNDFITKLANSVDEKLTFLEETIKDNATSKSLFNKGYPDSTDTELAKGQEMLNNLFEIKDLKKFSTLKPIKPRSGPFMPQ